MGARGIGKGDFAALSAVLPDLVELAIRDISVLSNVRPQRVPLAEAYWEDAYRLCR